MSFERRLQRRERLHIRQLATEGGKPYGLIADDILDETRLLTELSDAEQDTEFADALAQAEARGHHEAVRILTQGWAAVHSYRGCPLWALMTAEGIPYSMNHAFEVW